MNLPSPQRARSLASFASVVSLASLAAFTSLLAFVSLSAVTPAHAQPALLDPIVVTATRIPQPVSTLLSDVRVIDRDDIERSPSASLIELLQAQGGVEIATNGGPGQIAAVFMRGANANHVVVLIDGVRINSATSGTNAFENIPLRQIERIEIVRAPTSSLYGADAIGGVIQIFTKDGGNRVSAAAGAGTWNTRRYDLGLAREWGGTRFSVRAGQERSDAFSATNERNAFSFDPDDDPYRNHNATASLAHAWAPGHEVLARGFVSDGKTHFDAGPGTDDVNRQRLTSLSLESRNRLRRSWSSLLRIARGTDDIDTTGGFPASFRTGQDQATWQNDVRVAGGTLFAGFEYRRERVSSTTEYSVTTRIVRSAFGGYSGAFGAHLVQGSVRIDDNSQFGDRTTGSIGYGYRITPAWRVSASTGTAFKAPSFNDLYFVSPFFSGNPDLKPERSRSYEGAIRYDIDRVRVSLTAFENRIRDLIAVDPTFTTVVNVNEARIRGATLAVAVDAMNHRIKAEVTHADPIDVATGNLLVRRAKTFGSLSLNGTAGPWQWGGELVGSAERFDSVTNAPSSRLAGYGLVSFRAAYAFTPAFRVSARWNNVFDKAYELVRGYNTAGSNVLVMLEYAG